jgi:transglutaminase-like putative cysteine protease
MTMLIRLGYDIQFEIPAPLAFVAQLHVHPSRRAELREPDLLHIEHTAGEIVSTEYSDTYGNICTRFFAPRGQLRLWNSTLIEDSGLPDPVNLDAQEIPPQDLPNDVLYFLLNSRYCEVDLLSPIAVELFSRYTPGWNRVQAICNWVHNNVRFDYNFARPTKTALNVFTERVGVCRDFQHLAVTFCRCMNIPARYVAGYLGDIGVPVVLPMDFSAWFEVFLDNQWWAFDARNNMPRLGRILMATGRDAADVAFLTSFGSSRFLKFEVVSTEETRQELLQVNGLL